MRRCHEAANSAEVRQAQHLRQHLARPGELPFVHDQGQQRSRDEHHRGTTRVNRSVGCRAQCPFRAVKVRSGEAGVSGRDRSSAPVQPVEWLVGGRIEDGPQCIDLRQQLECRLGAALHGMDADLLRKADEQHAWQVAGDAELIQRGQDLERTRFLAAPHRDDRQGPIGKHGRIRHADPLDDVEPVGEGGQHLLRLAAHHPSRGQRTCQHRGHRAAAPGFTLRQFQPSLQHGHRLAGVAVHQVAEADQQVGKCQRQPHSCLAVGDRRAGQQPTPDLFVLLLVQGQRRVGIRQGHDVQRRCTGGCAVPVVQRVGHVTRPVAEDRRRMPQSVRRRSGHRH